MSLYGLTGALIALDEYENTRIINYTNNKVKSGDITWKSGFDPFVGAGIVFPGRGTSFFIEGIYYLGGSSSTEQQSAPFANRIGNIPYAQQQSGSIMEMGSSSLSGFIVNIGLRF